MTTTDVKPAPDKHRLRRWARSAAAGFAGGGWLRLLTAVAAGLSLFASFAPSTQWWAAITGIALLGLALHGVRGRAGYGLGAVFGAAFYIPLLSWTGVYVGSAPWLALAIVMALLTGLPVVIIAWAIRLLPCWPLWAAAAWVAGEALRGRWPFGGFPWGSLAFSQPDGPLLPAASLVGSAGLTFIAALAGFGLTQLLRALWRHRAALRPVLLAVPVVLIVAPFVVGQVGRISTVSQPDAAG
ncbi:MAG: apolipoprotein N-acyltransferase, partial [Actinomycetota bacterium]|nr:apolipoprotein N-acyltransferase [Actinomycetota bacterium]